MKIDRLIQQNEAVLRGLHPPGEEEDTQGPARTRQAFDHLNQCLHGDASYADTLKVVLSRSGGRTPRERVRNMLMTVASEPVLSDYTLRGSAGKRSFVATPTYRLITAAARDVSQRIVDSEIAAVLREAACGAAPP